MVFIEELIPIQRALTISSLEQGDLVGASAYLATALAMCEAGQYRPYAAEAQLLRAEIATRSGNRALAAEATAAARDLAMCDGPPFAYQRVLDDANRLSARLASGAAERSRE